MRRCPCLFASLLAWLWLGGSLVHAGTDVPEAYVVAAHRHGVPPEVLYAVASAESAVTLEHGRRPWPWTLNVAGRGYHFADRDSACEALYEALGRTRVVDVGIAQLNVRWQPQLFGAGNRFVDPCDALDPYKNLDEAAKLLRGHYDDASGGDWLVAAGRYHRPAGGAPAERYRRIVAGHLARLTPASPRAVPVVESISLQHAALGVVSATTLTTPVATERAPTPPRSLPGAEPLAADRSLVWVAPTDPVSWVDPQVRWDRLVAAQ